MCQDQSYSRATVAQISENVNARYDVPEHVVNDRLLCMKKLRCRLVRVPMLTNAKSACNGLGSLTEQNQGEGGEESEITFSYIM